MKLENDLVNFHPSPPRKSYNPFDSDDDELDSPGLKSANMYVKENSNGFDLKAFEKNSAAVIFHMDNGDFLWEEAMLGQRATDDHSANANGNTGLFKKEEQPYMDKNVTECELPEFVICYKESNIKDIGIDDGLPSHEKLWAQSGKDDDNNSPIFLDLSSKTDDAVKLQPPNSAVLSTTTSEHSENLDEQALTGQYLVHEFGDYDLLKITELKLDIEDRALPVDQPVAETLTTGGLVSVVEHHHPVEEKEIETSPSEHDKPDKDEQNHDDDVIEKKGHESIVVIQELATTQSPSELPTEHIVEVMPNESPKKEETLANSADATMQESADTHESNKMAYNSKVESRTITFNFSSSTNPKLENQEDEPQKPEAAKPPTTQTMTRQEEEIPGNSILLAKLEDRVHGETSFSAGMPVSVPSPLITYSEPLHYSGSLSLRSESSVGSASTRSFAFPVLHADWNSSPTRMGKASQKHAKKHRGWIQTLSCCKF